MQIEAQAREAVEYALMEAGALGTETTDGDPQLLRVTGYFEQTPNRESVRWEISRALQLYDLFSSAVREMNLREIEDQDWLGEWKKNWQPVEVGQRFVVAPPWAEDKVDPQRILIRIEPGMAFGTGTHETTRLCLAALERTFEGGSFLDVGTGTGILAIAAVKLFPAARVEACDTDADAIAIASENARLNNVAEKILFRVGTVEETTASADVVCANLTADAIISLLPALVSVTCGKLILSGILDSQIESVKSALLECALNAEPEIIQYGEWIAIIV